MSSKLYNRGMILGIDEVGRGPWAGPLVVGAVILGDTIIPGLTDSKKLSKKMRNSLDILIRERAVAYGLGWVDAKEIDRIGLSQALMLATLRAINSIEYPYDKIIIDGTVNFLRDHDKSELVETMIKADLYDANVSAASIIAKVARDTYMEQEDKVYPLYGFANHVGYGTAAHRAAIEQNGITPLHRLSFAPLKKYQSTAL
jgi:ribonuclease HII